MTGITADQAERYARHLSLAEIGIRGQQRLLEASVLVVGAGALGSPSALYLAAAGVGRIGIADHDRVRLSNLQRQVIHSTGAIGHRKVDTAGAAIAALNPEVTVEPHGEITAVNARSVLKRYDVVVDGTDSFSARYLLSDAAYLEARPLVHGSIFRVEGQVSVFLPGRGCYRCLYPQPPPKGMVNDAQEVGVFAPLPGVIGTIQAAETIKLITGIGEPLVNRVLLHDALAMTFRELRYRQDPACPLCGTQPSIRELVDYEAFVSSGVPA